MKLVKQCACLHENRALKQLRKTISWYSNVDICMKNRALKQLRKSISWYSIANTCLENRALEQLR